MKPVVQNVSTGFDDLLAGLKTLKTEQQLKNIVDLIIAKIQRKRKSLSEEAESQLKYSSGELGPEQFVKKLIGLNTMEARDYILKNAKLLDILDKGYIPSEKKQIVSDKADELVSHTRGFGQGHTPEDYLEEFDQFINNNINKIAALNVVCTRPQELTRDSLRSLKLELDAYHFTAQQLNTAWKELKNEDITADIISYIRRAALGSPLISQEERIKKAMGKLRKKHNFSKMELDWLGRIEKALLSESIIDRETFNSGSFQSQGGFERINKVFDGKLDACLEELNGYLYDDEGKTA